MGRLRSFFDKLGTVGVAMVMLLGGGLVWLNVCGQGKYQAACRFSVGCRSYYCLHHTLHGDAQIASDGMCTKSCTGDPECGAGYRCVVLSEEARGDLPPFGKPDRACVRSESSR